MRKYTAMVLCIAGTACFVASLGDFNTIALQPLWTIGCIGLAALLFKAAERITTKTK